MWITKKSIIVKKKIWSVRRRIDLGKENIHPPTIKFHPIFAFIPYHSPTVTDGNLTTQRTLETGSSLPSQCCSHPSVAGSKCRSVRPPLVRWRAHDQAMYASNKGIVCLLLITGLCSSCFVEDSLRARQIMSVVGYVLCRLSSETVNDIQSKMTLDTCVGISMTETNG
jgi:hypothetical protein